MYKLKDLAGDPIEGTFYESELQKVIKSEDVSYRVEKYLKEGVMVKPKKCMSNGKDGQKNSIHGFQRVPWKNNKSCYDFTSPLYSR